MNTQHTRPIRRVLAVILSLALLLTFTPMSGVVTLTAGAAEGDLTDFLTVSSSGTATGYFTYSDHFYKVEWSGINTSETTSVKLYIDGTYSRLRCYRNGNSSSHLSLYASASDSNWWKSSHITSLVPGQSSDGYTTSGILVAGANNTSNPKVYKKVCTVTCMAANAPTWNWSADGSTCKAEFTCTDNPSLTATVNAEVTTSGYTATASVTFNGTSYTDTKSLVTNYNITYILNGGTNASGNPSTYADIVGVLSFADPTREHYTFGGWYDNANFNGTPVTSIPAGSSGDKTLYAKWAINSYTVTWKNSDGSTLKTEQVNYGMTPSYSGETPTKASDGKYNYTFKEWSPAVTSVTGAVTYAAVYTKTPITANFSQDGDIYTIHDATGWDIFCDCLQDNDTYNRFIGKTVKLDADISVTRMAGGAGHDFKGTFDGQGHTLTVAYGTADSPVSDDDKAAPFRNVESGCVIKNLHTQGTIYTSRKYAGGIVGTQYGTVRLENCRSSVTINSMTAGDGTHGGLVGHNGSSNSAKLTIDGCVFDGKILSVGDDPTTNCAGFVGYKGNNVTITNSIYAPKALEADETEVTTGNSATFVRNGSAGANCYYTRTLGTAQGKQAYTISAGADVTLGLSGDATEYDVSGITAYADNSGIKYGNTFYAGSGDTVTLELNYTGTQADGYTFSGYAASAGTLDGMTLTMPDSNVIVTAEFAFSDGIGAALVGHSISLEGDIGVNYYTELSDAITNSETAKMHFMIPTGTGTITQDVFVKDARVDTVGDKTYYVFKCQIAAKEMTSQITAQLLDGDFESDVFPYSVKDYADWLLAHTGDNADYAKAAPLVKAMLNYGANSQLYFDKNTGNLANAGLTAGEKELGDVEITIADPVINPPDGVTFEGATLSLKSETTLSLYFTSSDDLTFSCDGYDVVPDSRGDYQIARIRGIKAADIGKILTLNVSGGTVSYSPLNYCKYVLADDTQNENLQNAVKALVLYWQAATAYFGAPAPDPAAGIFFTKVTDESEITRGNIGVCTFAQAKAWAIANWDDITDTEKNDVDIVFSADNDICYFSIKIGVTAIQDIEEMSEPEATGMEIDAIKYYYTYHEEDVYLCGRLFRKVTDESRITGENIGECTFDEAKAWVIANWDTIMETDSISVHIVFFNGNDICLISISEMTEINEFMEIDEPDTGVDIDFIQELFTNSREDVYLCSPAALP